MVLEQPTPPHIKTSFQHLISYVHSKHNSKYSSSRQFPSPIIVWERVQFKVHLEIKVAKHQALLKYYYFSICDKGKLTLYRKQVACTNYDSISGRSSSISMATLFREIWYYAAEYICTAFLGHFSLKCIYHSHLSPLFHLMTALDSIT